MTEQEQQELEMLRKEKRQRTQQQRAQAALETAGVPASFGSATQGRRSRMVRRDRMGDSFSSASAWAAWSWGRFL